MSREVIIACKYIFRDENSGVAIDKTAFGLVKYFAGDDMKVCYKTISEMYDSLEEAALAANVKHGLEFAGLLPSNFSSMCISWDEFLEETKKFEKP